MELTLPHVREAIAQGQEQLTLHNATKGRDYTVCLPLTQRQRGMILAGGLLNYTRGIPRKITPVYGPPAPLRTGIFRVGDRRSYPCTAIY